MGDSCGFEVGAYSFLMPSFTPGEHVRALRSTDQTSRVITFLGRAFAESWSVNRLAREAKVSRPTADRVFKAARRDFLEGEGKRSQRNQEETREANRAILSKGEIEAEGISPVDVARLKKYAFDRGFELLLSAKPEVKSISDFDRVLNWMRKAAGLDEKGASGGAGTLINIQFLGSGEVTKAENGAERLPGVTVSTDTGGDLKLETQENGNREQA